MNKSSKLLALLLSGTMMLSLASCGGGDTVESQQPEDIDPGVETLNPDDILDNMTSEDNTYEIAFITDVGQLKDKSFNQGTYDGVKLYATKNGKSYKYYQPANGDAATDDDRYDAMKAAVEGGAKVVVCAGFMQETALRRAATEFSDVPFVFVDGYALNEVAGDASSPVLENVAGIAFKEEQCGYLAGYAVVKEGYTKLGFSGGGGGDNPACCRYGYGFVQGAAAAAAEMDTQVDMKYSWAYGSNFSASNDLQAMVSGWYTTGTEVVFACGGSMFQSISAAASANDGLVVGVDVDQSTESETVITSAMKGLSSATEWAVGKVYDETFSEIGGTATSLGADTDAVGLPTATWSLANYTVEEYEAQLADIISGELVIDNDYNNLTQDYSNLTLEIVK